MKRFLVLMAIACLSTAATAQKADVAFTVGGSFVSDTTGTVTTLPAVATIKTDHHIFLEGTLGVRLLNAHLVSLHAELPVAGIPSQPLTVAGVPGTVDHLGTVFITPGLRLKIAPIAPISPWVSIGGGWARYSLNTAGVTQNKAALQYGGGLDFKTGLPLLGFRAEVRDFVTGDPDFGFGNIFSSGSGLHHHNILAGGGLVLRF
ncbi:MAG TPA: hypothetical protein VFB76_01365 [Candidatus Angelobacter sp.]|nr:hypothetical protein [Candidatus Angelobacter sp.]